MEAQFQDLWRRVYNVRGLRVMLDSDLALLYQMETKKLNQVVGRNVDAFPEHYAFQLSEKEHDSLRSQIVTLNNTETELSNNNNELESCLRSQFVTLNTINLKIGVGQHRKYLPYAFTERGVAMLGFVLKGPRARQVQTRILDIFVQVRDTLNTQTDVLEQLRVNQARQEAQSQKILDVLLKLEAKIDLLGTTTSHPPRQLTLPEPTRSSVHLSSSDLQKVSLIQETVARHYQLKVHELKKNARTRSITLPRQVAIFLIRRHTKISLKEIGTFFGGKDHSTVLHAHQRILSRLNQDEALREALHSIESQLRAKLS